MRKNLFKVLYNFVRFDVATNPTNEKLLFSEIFGTHENPVMPLPENLFLQLTLKPENEMISFLNSKPDTLNQLSFSEKMLLFSKMSHKKDRSSYSLELVEKLMVDLADEKNDEFALRNEEFLDKIKGLEITEFFPESFIKNMTKRLNKIFYMNPAKKWSILEKMTHQKSHLFVKSLLNEDFLKKLKPEIETLTKTQSGILIKLLSKTNQWQENNSVLMEILNSSEFTQKIEKSLLNEWEYYTDIVKFLNNYEELNFSGDFLKTVIDFMFKELGENPSNPVFLIRNFNYLLYKYNNKLKDLKYDNERKDVFYKVLTNNRNLIVYELVLMVFLKIFRTDLARIQQILTMISAFSMEKEPLNQRLSMLSLVIKVTLEEDFKRNQFFKKKSSTIIDKIIQTFSNVTAEEANTLESRDLASFFNSIHRIKLKQGEMSVFLNRILEKTIFFIKKDSFKFPTLLNILIVCSENNIKTKVLYVTMEEKIMTIIEENLTSLKHADLLLMKKAFKAHGFGSRKLHVFLEDAISDRSPENLIEVWKNYKKREAKYMDKMEKVRKSYKYANKRKNEANETNDEKN